MKNFDLYNPTKVLFGKGQMEQLKNEIPAGAKVLMLYGGGSIKKNGIYEEVLAAIKSFEVVEFGGIPANPEYEVLLKALEVIKREKVDFLLAVGGGSVIDGTKFLSAAALFDGDVPWEILTNKKPTLKGMPFGTVLTLPATGSEMNSGAVITRAETKEKFGMGGKGLFPIFSVLDPQVVTSIPQRQIANGLADSFTHVLEQYMTYPVGALLQDRIAEGIMLSIIETAPKILADTSDYNAASNFMWNCTMALNGLIQKGVPTDWAVHAMGHELTALYGIDHARTLAILVKSHYEYNMESKLEKLIQFGERVFNITDGTKEERALLAIQKIEDFFHSIAIKTKLSEYVSSYEGTAKIIADRFTQRGWMAIGERGAITPEDVEKIVSNSY